MKEGKKEGKKECFNMINVGFIANLYKIILTVLFTMKFCVSIFLRKLAYS